VKTAKTPRREAKKPPALDEVRRARARNYLRNQYDWNEWTRAGPASTKAIFFLVFNGFLVSISLLCFVLARSWAWLLWIALLILGLTVFSIVLGWRRLLEHE
jgi:hypothetical protein